MGARRLFLVYGLAVLVPGLAVVAALVAAKDGNGPSGTTVVGAAASAPDAGRTLLTIAIVVVAAHCGGFVAAWLRQPRVIGQAAVGLLLGPSLLGRIAPDAADWIHEPGTAQTIDLLAELGIILFVFLVGRELAGTTRRDTGAQAMVIGQAMIALPFLCGVLVAITLLSGHRPASVGPVPYALFLGLAMSATALPVLAHILTERGLLTSRIGVLATNSAVIGDVIVWCLLAVTMCLVNRGSMVSTVARLAAGLAFAAAMWWLVRPLLRRTMTVQHHVRHAFPALILAGLLLSAQVTASLGLHAIFGAFLFGLVVPRTSMTAQRVAVMAEGLTEWLLLPLFFTALGSRTYLHLIQGTDGFVLCLVVLAIAVISKLTSAGAASRAVGLGWRDSAAIGVAMNCRGMTELLILSTGLAAGIIDQQVFAIFVVMALTTTVLTGPMLSLLGLRQQPATASVRQPHDQPLLAGSAGGAGAL